MKKLISLIFVLVFLLVSCGDGRGEPPKGSRTIDGLYVCEIDDVRIAYIFETDGFGMQLLGDEQYNINYYILGNSIVIENFSVEGGDVTTLEFIESGGKVYIGGMPFVKVEEEKASE